MDSKGLACWNLLFHLLIVLGTCDFVPVDGTNAIRHQRMDVNNPQRNSKRDHVAHVQEKMSMHDHSHSSSHGMHQMDPTTTVFFVFDDLKLGKTMSILFPDGDPSPLSSPYLWPREQADPIPFSLAKLPQILQHFSFPQGSRKAQVMEDTLRACETKPIKGESKACATSYESLVDFARMILGLNTDIEVLSTHHLAKSNAARLQNYTITEAPERISNPKMVSCHTMPYPFIVFYCHYQQGDNRLYRTVLSGENGDKVEAIAICHMDTSQWNRDHVSFQMLGIEPGTAPVCHFFPAENFVLVPSTSSI
ncbi:BURP domain protein USPL1-like [Coffea eugenioides]|uniref:BURP domain protein USPL1-like n=1 Tax=Coffea arabica TaxID=13443 RepID=A0ABM4UWF9_COFAR|nr:BURP domain protein USPL1-like [Coffea eugenioides]XP_027173720.1 BURP domain protein USPL1-like [Coffea eugenioides]